MVNVLSFDNKNKKSVFCFVLFSLIRTFSFCEKVLSFDNKNKKSVFCFVLFSLIRTFAPQIYIIKYENIVVRQWRS